jgi:uncharacterized protein YggE
MKRHLLPCVLAALLTTICHAQREAALDARPKISVNGEAVVKVRPDRIIVNFGIETSDKIIDVARQKNADISIKAMAVFEACGVPRLARSRCEPA